MFGPCPYCGVSKSILIKKQQICWNIYCNSCGVAEVTAKLKQKAVNKWNRR